MFFPIKNNKYRITVLCYSQFHGECNGKRMVTLAIQKCKLVVALLALAITISLQLHKIQIKTLLISIRFQHLLSQIVLKLPIKKISKTTISMVTNIVQAILLRRLPWFLQRWGRFYQWLIEIMCILNTEYWRHF